MFKEIIKETQSKTMMRDHFTNIRMTTVQTHLYSNDGNGDVEKLQGSCIISGKVKWCRCHGKVCQFHKKLTVKLLYDLAISLLGIYPKQLKVGTQGGICTPMFIALSVAGAKRWTQPKCFINGRMDTQNVVSPYKGIVFSLKKQGNSDAHYNTDEDLMLHDISLS